MSAAVPLVPKRFTTAYYKARADLALALVNYGRNQGANP